MPTTTSSPTQIRYDDNSYGIDVRSTPAGPHVWPRRDSANGKYAGVFVPEKIEINDSVADCTQEKSNLPGTKSPDISTVPGVFTA